ncbi:unnamed protein product [Mytilus edulis]|uniref:Uncharacterized protein n=1 Tax=Mytilus edulis TaxID=6550 RepID=A0A8S3TN10_MYTED|nr:unnamed protein product [Mytilus edulis]
METSDKARRRKIRYNMLKQDEWFQNYEASYGRDEYLDSFIDTISKLPINYHNTKQNLSRREKKSLEELKNNPSIILKEADKGGGIVIMDKTFYREKVLEQLNDNEYYTKLRKNNDKSTIRKIKRLVKEYSESFTANEIAYLCDFTPKEANFYGLPKIHKSNTIQTAVKHQNKKYIESPNPNDLKLRPIVAGPESTTQRMSHFLDLILKKLCPLIPSYVRDDIDFLRASVSLGRTPHMSVERNLHHTNLVIDLA